VAIEATIPGRASPLISLLLLRHLNSVYKVLSQTVPDSVKTDMAREMELHLRDMLRGIDSSLLDEWEKMRDGSYRPSAGGEEVRPPKPEEPPDITRDAKAFTAAIRTRTFAFLRSWSIGNDEAALAVIDSPNDSNGDQWTAARLRAAREAYRTEHTSLRLDPEARNRRHTYGEPSDDGATWRVQQILAGPDAHNDWVMELDVDLAASREASAPMLRLVRVGGLV